VPFGAGQAAVGQPLRFAGKSGMLGQQVASITASSSGLPPAIAPSSRSLGNNCAYNRSLLRDP
jgi:hypothetical protein